MKLKHTQARKARRASAFHSTGAHDTPWGSKFEKIVSAGPSVRSVRREDLQPKRPKTLGRQIIRTQRIRLKGCNPFGVPVYKTIKHAAV